MKKIAILNDIHGNNLLLNKVLDYLGKEEKIDDFIFCGDNITDGFQNNEVLDLIKSKTQNVIAGNRELSIANYDNKSWNNLTQWKPMLYVYNSLSKENKEYLLSLPTYKIIEIESKKICISHGTPFNVREYIDSNSKKIFDELIEKYPCDIYLFGHTHKPFSLKYQDRLFINSGTINLPANGIPKATYGILIVDNGNVSYIPKEYAYDFEEVKNYYLNSDYFKTCPEYCNLLIYMLRDGFDYCCDFIEYIKKYSKGDEKITSELWHEKFCEYMDKKELKVF